jgi:hypothetical protein
MPTTTTHPADATMSTPARIAAGAPLQSITTSGPSPPDHSRAPSTVSGPVTAVSAPVA